MATAPPVAENRRVSSAWRGRVFLGIGDMLYVGPVGPTTLHGHHAFQLVLTRAGPMTLRGHDETSAVACEGAVVPSDAAHAVVVGCRSAVMLYVEPEGADGRRLRALAPPRDRGPAGWRERGHPLAARVCLDLPGTWDEADRFRAAMIDALVGPAARPTPQHPALLRALPRIQAALDRPVRLGAIAEDVGLSESRLAHLFAEELGLPFRTYVAWLRLRRAAGSLQAGASITTAAHDAGFADSAHFTRTFRRMFGIVPSDIAGVVDWVAAPSALAS